MSKRKILTFHSHRDCAKAKLIQYSDDPLIAECTINKERHVASTLTPCQYFQPRTRAPEIEYREKTYGLK